VRRQARWIEQRFQGRQDDSQGLGCWWRSPLPATPPQALGLGNLKEQNSIGDVVNKLFANYPSGCIRDWAIAPGNERVVQAWINALEREYTRQTGHIVRVVPGGPGSIYGELDIVTGQITIFHGEQYGGVVRGGQLLGNLWDGGTVTPPTNGVSAYRLEELYHWFQARDRGLLGRSNIPPLIRRAIEDEAGDFLRAVGCVPLR
jgi:hypothetical protein